MGSRHSPFPAKLKSITFFFLFNLILLSLFIFIFDQLIAFCFLPIGFIFTALGYLLNGVGIIACGVSSGMFLAMTLKKNNTKPGAIAWMAPLFLFPPVISLKFIFGGEWDYALLVAIPTLFISVLVAWVGRKLL